MAYRFEMLIDHRNDDGGFGSMGVGSVVTTLMLGIRSSVGNRGSSGALLSTGLV